LKENPHVKSFKLWLAALVVLVAPSASLLAQNFKPVAVVSIGSIKETLADISYLTKAAGMEDAGKSASFFASALTTGIDKEKPLGLYVVPKAGDFHAVAFIPLEPNGLSTILKVHKEQVGEPKDAGNGILEIGTDRTAFVREQGAWAFVAESKEHLVDLPPDPASLLGTLPTKYNFAGKLMIQNIPEDLRKMAISEIKLGIERVLNSPAAQRGNIDREQAQNLSKIYTTQIEKLITESDELMMGLGIDPTAKHVVLDVGFSAKEGTALARQMALQTSVKTNFSGFLLPEAAVTMVAAGNVSKEDIAQVATVMKSMREQYARQLDDIPNIPADKRDAIKGLVYQVFDVLEKTMAGGRTDGGMAVVLLPKSVSFIGGGLVIDGPAVEKILKSAVELGQGHRDFPQVQMNTGTLGDLTLHKLTANIPDEEARQVLGEKLEVIFAIGAKRFFVTGGKDAEGLLKKVLDSSAAASEKPVPPMQMTISALPILKFIRSIDDNPMVAGLIGSLEQSGNDRITILSQAGERSSTTRIEVQEGVIRAIGEGAKAAGAARGR
jgi:hypothetical protein